MPHVKNDLRVQDLRLNTKWSGHSSGASGWSRVGRRPSLEGQAWFEHPGGVSWDTSPHLTHLTHRRESLGSVKQSLNSPQLQGQVPRYIQDHSSPSEAFKGRGNGTSPVSCARLPAARRIALGPWVVTGPLGFFFLNFWARDIADIRGLIARNSDCS